MMWAGARTPPLSAWQSCSDETVTRWQSGADVCRTLQRLALALRVLVARGMKIHALFVASMLTGCATDDGEPDVDPVAFPTGIYSLHAGARSDTCDPARVTGDVGEVAVIVASDRIST